MEGKNEDWRTYSFLIQLEDPGIGISAFGYVSVLLTMGHSQPVLSKHTPLGWAPRGEDCLRMVWEQIFMGHETSPLWVPTFLRSPALLPNFSLWQSCSFPSLISLQVSQHYLIFSHWPSFDWDGLFSKVFDGFPILLKNKTIKILWQTQCAELCPHVSIALSVVSPHSGICLSRLSSLFLY